MHTRTHTRESVYTCTMEEQEQQRVLTSSEARKRAGDVLAKSLQSECGKKLMGMIEQASGAGKLSVYASKHDTLLMNAHDELRALEALGYTITRDPEPRGFESRGDRGYSISWGPAWIIPEAISTKANRA